MGLRHVTHASFVLCAVISLVACSESSTESEDVATVTVLLSVQPTAGATNVDLTTAMEIVFSRPVAAATLGIVALQIGECPGPIVSGQWLLSQDRTVLRFTPLMPLMAGTMYSIHVGGGMMDAEGRPIDLEHYGPGMGGQWVSEAMANGMGATGMGMGVNHAGPGWRHVNGTYGLAFTFTTGWP